MNYSPIQLDIIRTFGSKQLSEGCKVICNDLIIRTIVDDCEFTIQTNGGPEWNYQGRANEDVDIGISEILGHIPELFPDVARVAKEKGYEMTVSSDWGISIRTHEDDERESIPFNPTLPLIDQEESTLVQLLNLFKPS